MPMLTNLFLGLLSFAPQDCGGPCEVPRGADPVSADARYSLTPGPEKANWRYLFNWIWTENGEAKYRLEEALREPPLRDFGYRRMFVSPAGNGLLVTGNPYSSRLRVGKAAPLFVFCDPKGKILVDLPMEHMLTEPERQLGKCPGCGRADVLYVFEQDPSLTANGCFVELTVCATHRQLAWFLPLGLPVLDKTKFEATLAAAEWEAVTEARRASLRQEIDAARRDLGSSDPERCKKATDALVNAGFLALAAVRRASQGSDPAAARAAAIAARLRPWRVAGWDAMALDLPLHRALLDYPDADVVAAVLARLQSMLPPLLVKDGKGIAAWLDQHKAELKWNAAKARYEL
jgi:hypothetical protein